MIMPVCIAAAMFGVVSGKRINEVWTKEQEIAAGIVPNKYELGAQPFESNRSIYDFPSVWNWCDMDGTSYCTMSRNQHVPQYCGSCWAHGAVSALGDRIKIARKAKGIDINLSVQHILNCGTNVGTCNGGSVVGPYYWLYNQGMKGISYETSNPYLACSYDSEEGYCPDGNWECTDFNIAGTCNTFPPEGTCVGLTQYPNATIAEYGSISGVESMMKEIYERGPITCGIDAGKILDYTGGIYVGEGSEVDHVISVVGWGTDPNKGQYWIIRNSWGEYWGEFGYMRSAFGSLLVEDTCAWATLKSFTAPEFDNQVHCYEDGSNCD